MREPTRFFLPGPAYVRPEILRAQVHQPIPHRSAQFGALYSRVAERLQTVFRTKDPVLIATGSGTLMLESAVASLVERRVLNLVCGAFSARWHAISRALGKDADRVEVPLGSAIGPDLLREALRRSSYDAVTMVHCETSTGVLNPLPALAHVVREESDALVLVDAVSSLGGAAVETDEWGLDLVVTASQKALALPPGLSFAAISERARRRLGGMAPAGFYTDLSRYLDHHERGGTLSTPAESIFFALDRQLDQILEEGVEARWARHLLLRDQTIEWADGNGLLPMVTPSFRSPTVTTLAPPTGVSAERLVAALADEGFTVGHGYGTWKASTLRIGHMGDHLRSDLEGLFEMCEAVLDRF